MNIEMQEVYPMSLNPKNLSNGCEQYEEFYSGIKRSNLIQYDYRATNGELFSTVGSNLNICRGKRDKWLKRRSEK
jgi:hypothetical protein